MKDWILSTAWITGVVAAPHALALLGNLAGVFQWTLIPLLVAAVAVYWLNSASLADLIAFSPARTDELPALAGAIGPFSAIVFLIAGRLITAVTAATVLLVTAGFAFNETFVYWFPNFGFAFSLLALVLAMRIAGIAAMRIFQVATAAISLAGLAVLIAMGLWDAPDQPVTAQTGTNAIPWHMLFSSLLLFAGFDSALNHHFSRAGAVKTAMRTGLGLLGLALGLWVAVSILHTPAERLSSSFIPHVVVARAAGGQTGRMIMAIVIIAASCAAVNALFGNVSRTLTQVMDRVDGSQAFEHFARRQTPWVLVCGVGVALMLATGMAGTDAIDVYLRAGLYSWLLCYAAVHSGLWILVNRQGAPNDHVKKLQSAAGAVLMVLAFGILVIFDPERADLVRFMLATWTVLAALVLGGGFLSRFYMSKRTRSLP